MSEAMQWLYSLGRNAFDKKDYDDALDHFEKLVGEVQGFPDVWNMMGQIYHHQGEFAKAIKSFETALELNDNYVEAKFHLAVAYSEIGEYDKAQELYDAARKIDRGLGDERIPDPLVRAKIANMHADIGDIYESLALYNDAINEYKKALNLRPEFPDIRARMAKAQFESGQKEEAVHQLATVKASRPDFLKARLSLGICLYSMGKIERAVEEWNEILEQNPDFEKAKLYLRLAEKRKK